MQKSRAIDKIGLVKHESIKNSIKTQPLQVLDCGIGKYREILQFQHELLEKRRDNQIPNTVIIVEHPDVITLGARQSANKLLINIEELAQRNIDVVEIRRGGGTTAHNLGQLVFYPILNLQELSLGISEYIRTLENIGQELLSQSGLGCMRKERLSGFMDRSEKNRVNRCESVEICYISRHGYQY